MEDDHKSRTRKKKEDRALQALGEELVALSPEQLEQIPMQERLHEAVMAARKTKSHGARRRQMQYIGRLMRDVAPEPIENALKNIRIGDSRKALAFKKVEKVARRDTGRKPQDSRGDPPDLSPCRKAASDPAGKKCTQSEGWGEGRKVLENTLSLS